MLRMVTLDEIKAHLRIDVADTQEENELTLIAEGVEQQALNIMERSYESLIVDYGYIPADIRLAVLGRIASDYTTRADEKELKNSITIAMRPNAWQAILLKYKPSNKCRYVRSRIFR